MYHHYPHRFWAYIYESFAPRNKIYALEIKKGQFYRLDINLKLFTKISASQSQLCWSNYTIAIHINFLEDMIQITVRDDIILPDSSDTPASSSDVSNDILNTTH